MSVEARGGVFFAHVHGKWRRIAEDFSECLACGIRFARIAGKSAGKACGAACRRALTAKRNAAQVGEKNPHWKGKGGNYDWAAYQRADKQRHPDRHRARYLTRLAIARGDLVRQACERCDDPKSMPHHPDYAQPLLVMWLCKPCHRDEHAGRSVGRAPSTEAA